MKDKLIAFAEGREDQRTRDFFMREIQKVAKSSNMEGFLKKRIGDDYAEEVLAELRLKVFMMKEELEKKGPIYKAYIRKIIRSCLVDRLNGSARLDTISTEKLLYENEEGKVLSFEEVYGAEEDKDLRIQTEELFSLMMKILSEKDMEVLCYYLHKELYSREIKLKGMTKANLYKRWERLKKKISQKLPYTPTEEEFREFTEKFLSEVCDKRGYK